jgi:hypothetical protein
MNKTNASLAVAMAEAHRALLRELEDLERSAQPCSAAGPKDTSARLAGLRTRLDDHFRFEEQNGYMQPVLARAPHLERTVNQLRGEHDELRRSLVALVEEAGAARAPGADFWQKVRQWITLVREHEARENLLVEEAFNREFAAED